MRVWRALGEPPCHLTGGFLRDWLLGIPSQDLDLSLPGSADDIAVAARRLARRLGSRAHLLGQAPRCVWRVSSRELKVELWPLDTLTLEQDSLRRDFSCNALMWRLPSGPLVDATGGLKDLDRGLLRAISPDNLERDPVRLLRGPRFLATHSSLRIDDQTADWIRRLAPKLASSPRERVGQELLMLLRGDRPSRGLSAVADLDLLAPAAPRGARVDLGWLREFLPAADRLSKPSNHPIPKALRDAEDGARLGFLLRAMGKPDPDGSSEYAWNRDARKSAERAATLLAEAEAVAKGTAADRREMIVRAGPAFPALVALGSALNASSDASLRAWRLWWRQWLRSGAKLTTPRQLVSADEIAALAGVEQGPALGSIIRELQRAQARGDIRSPAGARRWLRTRRGNVAVRSNPPRS
jgi:tRNA nucleotidyltransferase/poly(A) polymerase